MTDDQQSVLNATPEDHTPCTFGHIRRQLEAQGVTMPAEEVNSHLSALINAGLIQAAISAQYRRSHCVSLGEGQSDG